MLLYRLECTLAEKMENQNESSRDAAARAQVNCCVTARFNDGIARSGAVFSYCIRQNTLYAAVALKKMEPALADGLAADYLAALGYAGSITARTEITLREFRLCLRQADRSDFIDDDDEFLMRIGLKDADSCVSGHDYPETVLTGSYDRAEAEQRARETLVSDAFLPELERIYAEGIPDIFHGHPVHYLLTGHSQKTLLDMRELLLHALLGAGRLVGRRCCTVDLAKDPSKCEDELSAAYATLSGGIVVLRLSVLNELNDRAMPCIEALAMLSRLIVKHRRDVLTIIECDQREGKLAELFAEELSGIALVRLEEDIVFAEQARQYLRRRAKWDAGTAKHAALCRLLGEEEKGYSRAELDELFEGWYDRYLRTELYPQYGALTRENASAVKKPRGSAIRELEDMIGLTEPKRIIREAIDFHKAQKLFADKGFCAGRPAMHMVFSGNPGTAKTTVARLFAQIMKDNGLLPVGKLVEVGRADLVGKYVGWTAQIVRDKFRAAKGSVLFIDEAYSLVEERGGLYGDEAINTIVQEMENARENTVVIFAGYTDKMREFIARNPGLRSRIAQQVDFPDYTADELMDIFAYALRQRERSADEAAFLKARAIFEDALRTPDFGNGRFVRTLVERAIVRQASRLMRMEPEAVTRSDALTLVADDFDAPSAPQNAERRLIGF